MASLGPMVIVAEPQTADANARATKGLIDALAKAGAFPIVEANWAEAPAAFRAAEPAALLVADAAPDDPAKRALAKVLAAGALLTPVLARGDDLGLPGALPVAADESPVRIVARLRSALRVRTLHTTVLRRSGAEEPHASRALAAPDLLAQASVLCLGRGRSYPALGVALGERVGVIGALSVEAAARYLNARDIEGVVIGDGFSPRVVEALLTVLAEDSRFRHLPIGILGGTAQPIEEERLPNLVRGGGDPHLLVERLLPYVRLQAFEGQLKRLLQSLTSNGAIDAETGLLSREAFWRDLDHAVRTAERAGACLSLARFCFEDADRRTSVDAARLLSRLVRDVDFACREQDGSILLVFSETDLRSAHVVARRIAAVLKHTMLAPERERRAIRPEVTLATLKPADDLAALATRLGVQHRLAPDTPAA